MHTCMARGRSAGGGGGGGSPRCGGAYTNTVAGLRGLYCHALGIASGEFRTVTKRPATTPHANPLNGF